MQQSSFSYKKSLGIRSLMVIIPHEDDEINTAGAAIYSAVKEGIHVKCVFMTNGDWVYPAFVRFDETLRALRLLGVEKEDVIFLGFPDGGNRGERSVYLHGLDKPVDAGGRTETYGYDDIVDYHYEKYGQHQKYTWEGLLEDLKDVIVSNRPDALMVTDFDYHVDHRMLSIAFEKVMGSILNEPGNTYEPLVFKGFAYATSYVSYKDYYERHFLASRVYRKEMRYLDCETDNPVYEWNKRLRFPVASACRGPGLLHNVLYKALICHMSQKNIEHVRQVFNGDIIFWTRRTNNLAYKGIVTVSSGEGSYLHDFQLMNTKRIADEKPAMEDYLWVPDDKEKWCRCDFEVPQHIEAMALYGNIEDTGRILKGKISFSNGFSMDVGPLKKQGHETFIAFPPQDEITWVRFDIEETEGDCAGLSEWEILPSIHVCNPFIQICVDGHFAYDWYVYPGEVPVISCYSAEKIGELRWLLDGQEISLQELNSQIKNIQQSSIVRAELRDNPEVWCETVIAPADITYRIVSSVKKGIDQLGVWWEHQMEKTPHHKLKSVRTFADYQRMKK